MKYHHRFHDAVPAISTSSPEYLFFRKQTAIWLLRLLRFELPIEDNFFSLAAWIAGGPEIFVNRLLKDVPPPKGRRRDEREAAGCLRDLPRSMQRFDDTLENIFESFPFLQPQIMDCVQTILEESVRGVSRAAHPLGAIKKLFGLDECALQICLYAFGVGNFRELEWYLEDQLSLARFTSHRLFAAMLGISTSQLREQIAALRGLGIIDNDDNMRLNDRLNNMLLNGTGRKSHAFFCQPLPRTTVPYEMFRIPEEEKEHVLKLLQRSGSEPVHILLYGAPGSGKTSFASCLAKKLKVKAWAVNCLEEDNDRDRRVSLGAALTLSARHPGSIVLVDEAERILDTDWRERGTSAKAWLNALLERKDSRIIWITNHIEHLDRAVRRRFSFSIHFEDPGVREAQTMWDMVAMREKVGRKLPPETRKRFARTYPLPIATMEMAVRQARVIADRDNFAACVERVLKAQVRLRNDGEMPPVKTNTPASYDEAAVCSSVPLTAILAHMRKLTENLGENVSGLGGMLFYGPPGTGKTAFAQHLAECADMECHKVRASDLLGMYVGETEKRIRQAFEYAEKNKALLLIDEADSFISSRQGAQRSWEVSQVNEFLTGLETFNGICICTTNFRTVMDNASMRRFCFKVEFLYARPVQIRSLYAAILQPLASGLPDEALLDGLCAQKCLTPGDFMAVRGQFCLRDDVTHEALVEALLREQKLKLESESKNLGF